MQNLTFQTRLVLFSVLCGALPLAILSVWSVRHGMASLQEVTAIRDTMRQAVQDHGTAIATDLTMLASSPDTARALQLLTSAFAGHAQELATYHTTQFGARFQLRGTPA
jgi:hypothetical protein